MQGRYFLLTIPYHHYTPYLPTELNYVRGQLEQGGDTGYLHWQLLVAFKKKIRLAGVKALFGDQCHAELGRSEAAREYVWKEETRVEGTQFELGKLAIKRNCPTDWDSVWNDAKSGNLESIPADIRIRSYHTIKRIRKDFEEAPIREGVEAYVFWGPPGTGKSHKVFEECQGKKYYVKGSTTKWWDGYKGEDIVIIDEFRGAIAIEHLLKWLDKWPCFVEEKGGQIALKATKFYICSNLNPDSWYPGIDGDTLGALRRRVRVTHFNSFFQINNS